VSFRDWFIGAFIPMGCMNLHKMPAEGIIFEGKDKFKIEYFSMMSESSFKVVDQMLLVTTPHSVIQPFITDTEFTETERNRLIAQLEYILAVLAAIDDSDNAYFRDLRCTKGEKIQNILTCMKMHQINHLQDLYSAFNDWHKFAQAAEIIL